MEEVENTGPPMKTVRTTMASTSIPEDRELAMDCSARRTSQGAEQSIMERRDADEYGGCRKEAGIEYLEDP